MEADELSSSFVSAGHSRSGDQQCSGLVILLTFFSNLPLPADKLATDTFLDSVICGRENCCVRPTGPCAGSLPRVDGVELHLLVAAVLAAERRVASVHEDVAVATQTFGAERARVQRRQAGLADRLGVEEEGAGDRQGHGCVVSRP
jgi:hypothetical protein